MRRLPPAREAVFAWLWLREVPDTKFSLGVTEAPLGMGMVDFSPSFWAFVRRRPTANPERRSNALLFRPPSLSFEKAPNIGFYGTTAYKQSMFMWRASGARRVGSRSLESLIGREKTSRWRHCGLVLLAFLMQRT